MGPDTCCVVTPKTAAVGPAGHMHAAPLAADSCPPEKESGFESSPSSPNSNRSDESAFSSNTHAPAIITNSHRSRRSSRVSLSSFKFIKKLGSGGYGQVLLVQKRSGRDRGCLYAMKVMRLSRAALVERDIMPRLHGLTYITHLAYAFYDAARCKAFLVMAYCAGKDLFSLVGPSRTPGYMRRMFVYNYPEYLSRVRIILAELSAVIMGLHNRGILYRDLKLENILVHGDGHIRLADFGLSRCFPPGQPVAISGKTGTPDYMAPEVIRSSGTRGPPTKYGYSADIWGLGIVAYELITGQLPFKGREVADLEEAILHDPIVLPSRYMDKFAALTVSQQPLVLAAFSFVSSLLQRDPDSRLTAEQIPSHVFFKDLDWSMLTSGVHDEPPFDVRRILSENPDYSEPERRVSPFTSTVSPCPAGAAAAPTSSAGTTGSSSSNGYDCPSKYRNYGFEMGHHGWRVSDECRFVGDNSWLVLPSSISMAELIDVDDLELSDHPATSSASCNLQQLPGLVQFELAAASESVDDLSPASPPPCEPPALFPHTTASLPSTQQQQSSRKRAANSAGLANSRNQLPPKKRRHYRHQPLTTAVSTQTTPDAGVCSPLPPFSSLRTRSTRLTAR